MARHDGEEGLGRAKDTRHARMRPILLKGHKGPLTCVKYNKDGDLLFTTCRRGGVNLWYSDDGERIGNYKVSDNPAAVMYADVNCE
eukprot:766099-Hanusia_phi.AAC.4